jgi:hypothetical protein
VNHTEKIAQVIVEAVIEGSCMVYRTDQSQSIHDFDLHYPDGRVVAMEVTASVAQADEETHAAVLNRRKGGPTLKAELCKKTWRIIPEASASINRIRNSVDRYLASIESAGVEHFFSASDRYRHSSVDKIYTELKVQSGDVIRWQAPGYIQIGLPIGGGFVSSGLVNEAVTVEAFKHDNRLKLAAARTAERHLFVFVDVLNHRVWTPLVHLDPAAVVPELPEEITHIWAVGPAQSSDQYVVWHAAVGLAWHSLGRVVAELSKP